MDIGYPSDESQACTDEVLLAKIAEGDGDAATALYHRYAKRLISVSNANIASELKQRFDAEDVIQSVFRSFFRKAKDGYYHVPASGEIWQLLLALALNKVRRKAIRHRALKRDVRATLPNPEIDTPTDDGAVAHLLLRMVVTEMIESLSPTHQQIVKDRIAGFEIAEIAERTDRTKRTVERSLQQFRRMLSEKIDDD